MNREIKAVLAFILGFVVIFATGIAFAGTITEIWHEEWTGISFAYIEDGKLIAKEGNENIFNGGMPRNIIKEKVHITENQEGYDEIKKPDYIDMSENKKVIPSLNVK